MAGFVPRCGRTLRRASVSFVFRLFCTVCFASLAALGATSWLPVAAAAACGFVVDIVRNLFAPECRSSPASLLARADEKAFDLAIYKEAVRRRMEPLKYLVISWILFVFVFAVAVPPREDVTLSSATRWSSPLADWLAAVTRVIRLFPAELASHGFPHRAQVVALFYTVNIFFLALTIASVCTGFACYTAVAVVNNFQSGKDRKMTLPRFWATLSAIAIYGLGTYYLGSNLSWIRWQGSEIAYGWKLASENSSFIWFFLCVGNTALASVGLYMGLSALRVIEWRD